MMGSLRPQSSERKSKWVVIRRQLLQVWWYYKILALSSLLTTTSADRMLLSWWFRNQMECVAGLIFFPILLFFCSNFVHRNRFCNFRNMFFFLKKCSEIISEAFYIDKLQKKWSGYRNFLEIKTLRVRLNGLNLIY